MILDKLNSDWVPETVICDSGAFSDGVKKESINLRNKMISDMYEKSYVFPKKVLDSKKGMLKNVEYLWVEYQNDIAESDRLYNAIIGLRREQAWLYARKRFGSKTVDSEIVSIDKEIVSNVEKLYTILNKYPNNELSYFYRMNVSYWYDIDEFVESLSGLLRMWNKYDSILTEFMSDYMKVLWHDGGKNLSRSDKKVLRGLKDYFIPAIKIEIDNPNIPENMRDNFLNALKIIEEK